MVRGERRSPGRSTFDFCATVFCTATICDTRFSGTLSGRLEMLRHCVLVPLFAPKFASALLRSVQGRFKHWERPCYSSFHGCHVLRRMFRQNLGLFIIEKSKKIS
jgi:hypothetical protein